MTRDRPDHPWLALQTVPPLLQDMDEGTDVWVAHLDGSRCRRNRQFFDTIAESLEFPDYFGHNWNAFDECFRDLFDITDGGMGNEWGGAHGRPEHTLHLRVLHAEDLLVDADPHDLGIVLENFRAPYHHYDPPQPWRRWAQFRATFVCAADEEAFLLDRLELAGLRPGDLMR